MDDCDKPYLRVTIEDPAGDTKVFIVIAPKPLHPEWN